MLQKKVPEGEEMASWTEYSLGQLLSYEQPTAYIVESADYNDSYRTPVVTAGKTFILGYTNEDKGVYSSLPVIIFDDFTTASKFVNFKFKVKSSAMKILTTNSELVLPKFIFYRMQIIKFDASTHKRYWIQHYSKIKVRIPPILEQERIVARIEELFSQLDAGVAELKTAKERLKVYRQAVLNSCLGDGTLRSIGECIKSMGQGWSPKCERISIEDDDSWAVITTTAIQPMNFSFKENKKLPDSLEPRVKHELKVGDLLITRAGPRSRCGVCCMVKQTKKRLLNCDKVYCLKVNDLIVLPEYMEAVLNAPNFQREIAFCKTGGNDSGVNLTQSRFLSIEVPTPSLDIQKMILAKIDANLSVCDSIEKTVDTALQQAEALRQSILKKAFEGGL
jgi:type I restriction enzyme S subunit